jgi:hypothetical protein
LRRADAQGRSIVTDAFMARQQYTSARSDQLGRFVFEQLAPGRYVVGLNLEGGVQSNSPFVPVMATVPGGGRDLIDLLLGGQRQLLPIVARVADRLAQTGRVLAADGRPAAGLRVFACALGESSGVGERVDGVTDADGRFSLSLAAGQRYRLNVGPAAGPDAREEIVAGANDVTLTLRPSR